MINTKNNKTIKRSLTSSIRIVLCLFVLAGLNSTIKAQVKSGADKINKVTSGTTIWTIDATHTWKQLQNYMPKAKSSGTTVYVGVLAPSDTPPINPTGSYSEPYRNDYITWAKEIAKLSLKYSNLKIWAIKSLQLNLDKGYLRQSYVDSAVAAGKAVNSNLVFDPTIYTTTSSGDVTPPPAQTNFTAAFHTDNTGSITPLSISPSTDSNWNADWEVQSLKDRVYIVANPHTDAVNPSPSVSRVQIFKNDNYSGLANGKPRAEFERRNFNFTYGHTFRYTFKNYFPSNFKFDYSGVNNANILNQIKQSGAVTGAPPRCFGHNGTQYYVEDYVSIPGGNTIFHRTLFGDASADAGKWVKWTAEFKADSLSGSGHGYYKLYKDDVLVYSDNDRTWAYTKNTDYYLKVGAYKPDWLNYSSQQDSVTIYVDDIQITDITTNVTTSLTDFAVSGTTSSSYVDLNWTNPTVSDFQSTYIYYSLTNDSSTAKLLTTVGNTTTTYRDALTTSDKRYYWLKAKDTSGNMSSFTAVATY